MNAHQGFRNRIPVLREVPDEIYFNLDSSDWQFPSKDIPITQIEEELQAYVMTYNLEGMDLRIPPEKHLCAHLTSANLSPNKVQKLKEWESKLKPHGITLAAYEKPIKLRKPRV